MLFIMIQIVNIQWMSVCASEFKTVLCIFGFGDFLLNLKYSKTCVKWPLSKRPKVVFQDQLLLYAGQKYCRMLQGVHSAILLTFMTLPLVIKIFVLLFLSGRFTQVLL